MPRKALVTPEREIQRAIVAWFSWQYPLDLMFAIPNQLVRGRLGALVACRDGVVPGIPDLFIACGRGGFLGLFVEVKAEGGRLSEAQERMLALLCDRGYLAKCCVGVDEGISLISDYMRGVFIVG